MSELSDPQKKIILVQRILEARYGEYLYWVSPVVENHIGPELPKVFDKFHQQLDSARKASMADLRDRSYAELAEEFTQDGGGVRLFNKASSDSHSGIIRRAPVWFAEGFGNQNCKADFTHWSQMAHFSEVEANCLTIGFEPEYFDAVSFERHSNHPSIVFFFRRMELFNREFSHMHDRISRLDFQAWLKAVHLEVHPELLPALERATETSRYDILRKSDKAVKKATQLDNREKVSMAKIITAIAIDAYGFDPTASRSPIPHEIEDIAARLGVDITDDTIRLYLKLGAEYLPDDWQSE